MLFIVKFNGAALRPQIPRFVFSPQYKNQLTIRKATGVKFVDDLSVAVSVHLPVSVVKRDHMPLPPSYHERTGHILPNENTIMSSFLDKLQSFSDQNLMKINHDKTKLMLFNKSKAIDFLPSFPFGHEDNLEVIESTRLLGIILSSDLKWERNTQFICAKAMSRLWLLRRMKRRNLDPLLICDYYTKEIRPVLELAAPAWHSNLTKSQSTSIERVQKTALRVILGDLYTNYEYACSLLSVTSGILKAKFVLQLCKEDSRRFQTL